MQRLAVVLKRSGFVLIEAFAVFAILFAAGSAIDDPGGWAGLALIASWAVPLVVLAVLAAARPQKATLVLALVGIGIVALNLWATLNDSSWDSLENDVGPIRAIASIAVAGPLGILGLRRARAAGLMLLVVGAAPVLLSASSLALRSAPLVAITAPIVLAGALFLSASMLGSDKRPARTEGGSAEGRSRAAA